jgi:hypothetical protein
MFCGLGSLGLVSVLARRLLLLPVPLPVLNVARRAGTALRTRTGRGAGTAPTTAAAFSSSAAGARPSTRAAAASGPGAAATAPTVLG